MCAGVRVGTVVFGTLLLMGCATRVPLPPDNKWRNVYAIQIPDVEKKFELTTVAAAGCSTTTRSAKTDVRIIQLQAFQNLRKLPEKADTSTSSGEGLPTAFRDTGPLDMSLYGSKRLVPLVTGKSLLARSTNPCAVLEIYELSGR